MTAEAKRKARWTWAEYQAWPAAERWELIGGEAFSMAPAPTIAHQTVALRFAAKLEAELKGKPCRPFIAPTDVKLSDEDVVQPYVFVVCDPAKVGSSHISGAPDLVVEVLSPATATRDLREKKALYARHGIGEYVIVDPLEQYAMRFALTEGRYGEGQTVDGRETLVLASLDGLSIPLWEIFDLPAPGAETTQPGPGR